MSNKHFWNLLFFSISILLSISCKKSERPITSLEDERFTNFQITFNPIGGGPQIVFGSEDLGDVGVAQAASSGPLAVNTLYDARVLIFNRKVEPNKNLTPRIEEESTKYQLFIDVEPNNVFQSIDYEDMDNSGQPIGLHTTFMTSERFTTGRLRFIFKRDSDKSVAYVPGNNLPAGVGGESLIDVDFEVIVQ